MNRPHRLGALSRLAVVIAVAAMSLTMAPALGSTAAAEATPGGAARIAAPASDLPRWSGGVDLYRIGVFTTQKTWLWCTAADVQIISNIVRGATDHTRASQQRSFDYMRAHNRYAIPVSDGVDPAGWEAGLRQFVDRRYALYESTSYDTALRSAVTNLRETNLPVAITVDHGNHAWVITGFSATADPAVTTDFTVSSVRVVGPLWGLQDRAYGYDMRPDTSLTPQQLATFFTPWHYGPIRMAWEGRWVAIQPVADAPATAAPPPSAGPTDGTTVSPGPGPTTGSTGAPASGGQGMSGGSPSPPSREFGASSDGTARPEPTIAVVAGAIVVGLVVLTIAVRRRRGSGDGAESAGHPRH